MLIHFPEPTIWISLNETHAEHLRSNEPQKLTQSPAQEIRIEFKKEVHFAPLQYLNLTSTILFHGVTKR